MYYTFIYYFIFDFEEKNKKQMQIFIVLSKIKATLKRRWPLLI